MSAPTTTPPRARRVPPPPKGLLAPTVALILGLAAAKTAAQLTITVTTEPPAPTSGTPVTIVVFNSCGCPMYGTPIVRNGFTFDIPYGPDCLSACLAATSRYEVGPLEPGSYTVRQILNDGTAAPEVIGGFVVAAAAIPALGVSGALALALLLALAALRRLHLRTLRRPRAPAPTRPFR